MVARTRCLLSSSTRNIVPGSTVWTRPSTSICSSFINCSNSGRLSNHRQHPPNTGRTECRQTKERGPVLPGPERKRSVRLVTIATATAAAAAAATVTTATAAATATGALFARPRNVNRQGAPAQFFAIQSVDGLLRLLGRAHGDEGKS